MIVTKKCGPLCGTLSKSDYVKVQCYWSCRAANLAERKKTINQLISDWMVGSMVTHSMKIAFKYFTSFKITLPSQFSSLRTNSPISIFLLLFLKRSADELHNYLELTISNEIWWVAAHWDFCVLLHFRWQFSCPSSVATNNGNWINCWRFNKKKRKLRMTNIPIEMRRHTY